MLQGFVLALLLLMPGLGALGVAPAEAPGLVAGPAGVGLDCVTHDEDGGRAPLAHCAHCCILCDAAFPFAAPRASTEAILRLSLGSASPRATNSPGCLDRRPPGWASSWSSQAPPRFS
jgi:hypothetical protein